MNNAARLANTIAPKPIQKLWANKLWKLADTIEAFGHEHIARDIRHNLIDYVNVTPVQYKAFVAHVHTRLIHDLVWECPETGEGLFE